VITVCKKAEERCPTFPGVSQRLDWSVEDPATFVGAEEAKLAKFREVRDQINDQVNKEVSFKRRIRILEVSNTFHRENRQPKIS
jgi:arsenate reductase